MNDALIPPPPAALANLLVYPVFRLFALAAAGGGRVTSGFRYPGHNAEVGGVSNSAHEFGVAVDVVGAPAGAAASFAASFPGALALDEGDHLHLAWPRAAAWLILILEALAALLLFGWWK